MTISLLIDFESKLPDDIVEYIYTKVIYNQPKDLLDHIKYRYKIKKYISILRNVNISDKYVILYDILIVYYSVIDSDLRYVKYNNRNIPENIINDIVNDINSAKKIIKICIDYLLEIPFCHIKYIFKKNRPYI
tara:strand:+ start:229 stop:627 length:399 start_codon:yes stop_codon:yes gene_type:complete